MEQIASSAAHQAEPIGSGDVRSAFRQFSDVTHHLPGITKPADREKCRGALRKRGPPELAVEAGRIESCRCPALSRLPPARSSLPKARSH